MVARSDCALRDDVLPFAVAAFVAEHVQKPGRQINRMPQLERAQMREFRSDRLSRRYVNQFIFVRADPFQHVGSTRTEGVVDMSEQPSNGMPDWLTTDMLVIAVALVIIVMGIWIAP
ncbi:hypothetical protein [Bradyrhizobium acaciae]|uniref:hypothetical protein n=1 Tax=Bradyrhizobium acaciae TaxID=2683706 RepID=UPI001E2C0433|nr:hypothetical protein [Bradyrhizobium acaciae]